MTGRKHGTRTTYNFGIQSGSQDSANGCRCPECTEANSDYQRRKRASYRRRDYLEPVPDNYLRVLCWCRAESVPVPQVEVMRVLTRSCGRPECDSFDRQHRKEAG